MKCDETPTCGCDGCRTLHLLLCEDPDCAESICVAARRYNRMAALVQTVDSAENVRLFFQAKLPLERLVMAFCPGCGTDLFVTVGQMIAWERSEHGEPVALVCSDRCAAKVAAELAAGGQHERREGADA
jgi:hypothetical protein